MPWHSAGKRRSQGKNCEVTCYTYKAKNLTHVGNYYSTYVLHLSIMSCVYLKLSNELNYLLIYVECHEVLGNCQMQKLETDRIAYSTSFCDISSIEQ
jgi:hypothetical protein